MKLVLSAVACIVASATLSGASEPRLHLRHVADYEYDEVEAYNNPAKKAQRDAKKVARQAQKQAGANANKAKHVNGRGFHGKGKARREERRAARKGKNAAAKKADRAAKKVGRKGKNCANTRDACKSLTKNTTGKAKMSINGCPCYMYEEQPLADFFDMYEEDEIDFIADFLFDSYDEDSYDEDEDESDSEDYYSYN